MKIYLDDPIVIEGVSIGLTKEGLKYRVEQLQRTLKTARPEQLGEKERAHIKETIERFNLHILLYERTGK